MRIAICGSSGSGKSTLAAKVAGRLRIPHIELDEIHHLKDWQPNPRFLEELEVQVRQQDWVCDGNYRVAEQLSRGRADIIVVIDLPRWRVMMQLIHRTLRRFIRREVLWNGNRESFTNLWSWNPEKNVIRWSWVKFHQNRRRYRQAEESGEWSHAQVVWLRSRAEAAAWLEGLAPDHGPEALQT